MQMTTNTLGTKMKANTTQILDCKLIWSKAIYVRTTNI